MYKVQSKNLSFEILDDSSEITELNKDLVFHWNPYINIKECPYETVNDSKRPFNDATYI